MTDLPLLQELYRENLSALLRHQAGARLIRQYDANNTYQYIINREEMQLSWVRAAIESLDGAVPHEGAEPDRRVSGQSGPAAAHAISEEDARDAGEFVERWRQRGEQMNDARHRGTLRVILGETLEQKRFFEQALAGQMDLLGRRPDHVGPRVGEVLNTRWIE